MRWRMKDPPDLAMRWRFASTQEEGRELAEERKHPGASKKRATFVGSRRTHRYLSRYEAKFHRCLMMCVSTLLSNNPTDA